MVEAARLLAWLRARDWLRVFPAEGAEMVVRLGRQRIVYRDTTDPEALLRAAWTEAELEEWRAEWEREG